MIFTEFLKEKREALGISQNKFAKMINITQSYFNSIERGEVKNPPSEEVLLRIADCLNLNPEEKEQMLYLAAIERTPKIIIDKIEKLKNEVKSNIKKTAKEATEISDNAIPLFERISAGLGAFTDNDIEDYIMLPGLNNTNQNLFAVNVVGDSMEPTIKDGSIIICKKTLDIKSGEIGAFFIDEQAFVKRLKITKNYIALVSDNPNYSPIYIGPGENFNVVGKVIKVLSDI
ncbi:LexA family transcriptional regulator [Fusobacterium perfoetens]|uniref:LexA family transcriptional regulator n=1 Tax=Fusobacterium perfoetens TaxID=852 RepID=UPI00048581B7|nr:LexA family transcriptional regulator [Fusobacterium perfoetens]MCI6153183.1 LexA family transcriptional regulator [Fusobacterium perfoetens]MDY3237113.1 LexA family transcriptional regulator [Fusobacterium perfoetens]